MKLGRHLRGLKAFLKPSTVPAFHSYWTKPSLAAGVAPSISRLELLTIVYGIHKYKQLTGAPFYLHCDPEGMQLFERHHLLEFYDAVEAEVFPRTIDARRLWAANKIYAYRMFGAPSVSIDLDAVITAKLPLSCYTADFAALHEEPLTWKGYANNEEHFSEPLSAFKFDWSTPAVNMGVCMFMDHNLVMEYVDQAIKMLYRLSHSGYAPQMSLQDGSRPGGFTYFEEMIFTEQRLLPLIAKRRGFVGKMIAQFSPAENGDLDHMVPSPYAFHLWNSKRQYALHSTASEAFTKQLLYNLITEFPEVRPWLFLNKFPCEVYRDANLPGAYRLSYPGDWFLPGEQTANQEMAFIKSLSKE
jgi:hypothetical protein